MALLKPYAPKPRYIPKNKSDELTIQRQACRFLDLQYPQLIYRSDFASGLKLTPYQAKLHKSLQSSRGFPDIFIYEPREVTMKDGSKRFFSGCAVELKKPGTTIVLKVGPNKGHLTSDPHIREQYALLKRLADKGYYTNFAVGIEEFITIVNWYMGAPQNTELAF